MQKVFFKKKNKENGFTIIETMIALSVFIVVVMAGMSALLNTHFVYNKTQNTRSIMDNMSFVMEEISRSLRTGYDYHCMSGVNDNSSTPLSGNNCQGISFTTSEGGERWEYFISGDGKIFKSTPSSPDVELTSGGENSPNDIIITELDAFSVFGAEAPPGNQEQPFVTIRLSGEITYKNGSTPFSLQTSISQRLVDL